MAGGNLNCGNASSDWSVCGHACGLFSWLWIDVPGSSPEWAVPPLGRWSRGVQEMYKKGGWMWVWKQGSELLSSGPTSPLASFCDVLNDRLQSDQPFPSRVAFGHGASPSKGEQTKTTALCAKERQRCSPRCIAVRDTTIPRECSFLPPESFPIFSTKWDHHTSFRWGEKNNGRKAKGSSLGLRNFL